MPEEVAGMVTVFYLDHRGEGPGPLEKFVEISLLEKWSTLRLLDVASLKHGMRSLP